jgi:hypothetical protein
MTTEPKCLGRLAQVYQPAFDVLKVQAVDPMAGFALRILPAHTPASKREACHI